MHVTVVKAPGILWQHGIEGARLFKGLPNWHHNALKNQQQSQINKSEKPNSHNKLNILATKWPDYFKIWFIHWKSCSSHHLVNYMTEVYIL